MIKRWFQGLSRPSYVVFFVTARCNAKCPMCFYAGNMEKAQGAKAELAVDEYRRIARGMGPVNILGISGGEPFLRPDLAEIVSAVYRESRPLVVDLPTNGSFTDSVVRQATRIAADCPEMTVDVQLSLDGPEAVHNAIRGLCDGYARQMETYRALVVHKARHPNLRLKSCAVYSALNQAHIAELLHILENEMPDLDRTVFSVAHGSVADQAVMHIDWDDYFAWCERIAAKASVKRLGDVHSLLTVAMRMVKNSQLKRVLAAGDHYKSCGAGKRVVAVGESGQVYPCEPLWQSVGNLRENGYDLPAALGSSAMRAFQAGIKARRCTCHWGLPMSNNLPYRPGAYPELAWALMRVAAKTVFGGKAQ